MKKMLAGLLRLFVTMTLVIFAFYLLPAAAPAQHAPAAGKQWLSAKPLVPKNTEKAQRQRSTGGAYLQTSLQRAE